MHSATARRIIRAYDDPIVRAYCWARFSILRQRFLDEIGQYLPQEGPILDIGCGFGLFSLYYAATGRRRLLRGLDLNPRRIAQARLRGGVAHEDHVPAAPQGVPRPRLDVRDGIRPGARRRESERAEHEAPARRRHNFTAGLSE